MKLRSIKSRIIFIMIIVILGISTIFSIMTLVMKQTLEEAVLANMVEDELNERHQEYQQYGQIDSMMADNWQIFLPENFHDAPGKIKRLPIGVHHSVKIGDLYYQVERQKWENGDIAVMYDISKWEYKESRFFGLIAYSVILIIIFSTLMTKWATKAILEPLKELSNMLTTISPAKKVPKIQDQFVGSEIHEIAGAFDAYSNRLKNFIERERMFTNAASHELRTPLSVLMGAIDILEIEAKTPPAVRALKRIHRACSDMSVFIEATLFLSREHVKFDSSNIETKLFDVIEKIIDDNEQKIRMRNIVMNNNVAHSESVNIPETMVKIVASNLIRNAIEHSSHCEIDISFDDGTFCVRDFGDGIPKEDIPKVFDRNYSTKSEGTGMGLHLVKRIADRFDWEINIMSDSNIGTQVSITF